jgi:hypothetical protein
LNRARLRFARARSYIAAMSEVEYWRTKLREAEAELDAAKTLTAVKAAASKLQRVKAELKALEGKAPELPKRRGAP